MEAGRGLFGWLREVEEGTVGGARCGKGAYVC
jgi:hypothetical protein